MCDRVMYMGWSQTDSEFKRVAIGGGGEIRAIRPIIVLVIYKGDNVDRNGEKGIIHNY